MNPQPPDAVLDLLRPRMRSARASHLRRIVGGAFVIPALAVGAAALVADGATDPGSGTAVDAVVEAQALRFVDPEIGSARGDEASIAVPVASAEAEPSEQEEDEDAGERAPIVVSLGEIGHATVQPVPGELRFELLDTSLADGWVVVRVERNGDTLLIVVRRGDVLKVVKVRPTVGDEVGVEVVDLVIPVPPTTTTTTTTTTTKPPATTVVPVPVERIVVDVGGRGSFVAERDGDRIDLVSLSPDPGYEAEVMTQGGWKVHVVMTDGGWNWHAKVFIDDAGAVKQHHWDEERIADPIYQWVEITGVGAARFKLYDHQIWVKEVHTAPGIEGWDEHGGQPAEHGKVSFEGDGAWWCIEAFEADDEIVWEISTEGGDPIS